MLARLAPAIFVLLWSTGWVVAKYAAIFADPLTFLALRYSFAILLFIGFCLLSGARWPRSATAIGHAVVSGIFLHGLYLGAVWWAIGQGVPAAISGIIAGLQPLMTAAVAPWLIGEKLAGQQKLGLILGFCGIALAVAPKMLAIDATATPIHLLPLAVNVLGMAAVTYGTLYQKRYLQTGDIRSIAALQYVGALLVTIPWRSCSRTCGSPGISNLSRRSPGRSWASRWERSRSCSISFAAGRYRARHRSSIWCRRLPPARRRCSSAKR